MLIRLHDGLTWERVAELARGKDQDAVSASNSSSSSMIGRANTPTPSWANAPSQSI
jgi:hypothetical protein